MTNLLTDFWSNVVFDEAPFAHPDDRSVLQGRGLSMVFHAYLSRLRVGPRNDSRLHLSLLPRPYCGDIGSAQILILGLNPGLQFSDYHAEFAAYHSKEFLDRSIASLRQEFVNPDFPFMWLDPELCWHSGFIYWEKKFRELICCIAETFTDGRYVDAMSYLSRRIATIELVPYHSKRFDDHDLIELLPSAIRAKQFVRSVANDTSANDGKLLIALRARGYWDIRERDGDVVCYSGGAAQSASLGMNSSGGKAILRKLGIQTEWDRVPKLRVALDLTGLPQ